MTDPINLTQLRERATTATRIQYGRIILDTSDLLALLDVTEAAHEFHTAWSLDLDLAEIATAGPLERALTKFAWNNEP